LAVTCWTLALVLASLGYPWLGSRPSQSAASTIQPPVGFVRVGAALGSFGAWLRDLPLIPGRPPVFLFDGHEKANQGAHHAVVDLDVGRRDLQQCADAVIRLRAEYLLAAGREDEIAFHFTSGDLLAWREWREGVRPVVGRTVRMERSAAPARDRAAFRAYLDTVFTYAGSRSVERELVPVPDARRVEAGDVFIRGGSPGHAVLVLDVAEDGAGRRAFLLGQSYMPAQQFHVLRNPGDTALSPWYIAAAGPRLETPEWTFAWSELRRFLRP
jgi:hypothetical protein